MDNRSANIIESREKGLLPLSIATSTAIESIFNNRVDPKTKRETPPAILTYGELWINFRTLFRNFHGSMQRETADTLPVQALVEALHREILVIQSLLENKTNHRCKLVLYASSYRSLKSHYPNAIMKESATHIQTRYSLFENNALDGILNLIKEIHAPIEFKIFNVHLTGNEQNTLIMTHYPVDLINYKRFKQLDLLESHTGTIKPPHQWYTKLKGGKENPHIPFNKATIQLFGETGGIFSPYPKPYREAFIEAADKYKWNQTTQRDRIELTLGLIHKPQLHALVKKMFQ